MKAWHIAVAALMLTCQGTAWAEFMKIQASEIVTIQPADQSEGPRLLVRWKLPEELGELIVDGAAIEMKVPVEKGDDFPVQVAPLETNWSADEVAWADGWSKDGGDFSRDISSVAIVRSKRDMVIRADVYLTLLEQISGARQNFGFIVVSDPETQATIARITANDESGLAHAELIIAYRERR